MNIALLEDNPSNLEYLLTLLQLQGHLVFPHRDATAFLDTVLTAVQRDSTSLSHTTIDLALLDLMLPGQLSGLDVLSKLRETNSPLAHLPVIVISGAGQNVLDEMQMRFPTVPVLRKPFHMGELLSMIKAVSTAKDFRPDM